MKEKFNPDMLHLARELRDMTQSELASRIPMAQAFLSQVESGSREITEERLARIADALDLPVPFFYQREQYTGVGISLVYYRKRASAQVGDLRRLQAEVNLRRIHITRLLRGLNIRSPRTFSRMDIDDYGSPEEIAQLVRAGWQLPLGPIKSLVTTIESAGAIVLLFPFGTSDIDAVSQWPDDAPPFFFLNSLAPTDRLRFSLAHEVGHVLMHGHVSDAMEDDADRFAAEFLMPAKEIATDLQNLSIKSAASLKPYWRVSMAALFHRAYDIGVITKPEYTALYRHMSRLGYRKNEPWPLSPEPPLFVNKIIESYRADSGYSDADLARLLNVHDSEFKDRYLSPSGLRLVGKAKPLLHTEGL